MTLLRRAQFRLNSLRLLGVLALLVHLYASAVMAHAPMAGGETTICTSQGMLVSPEAGMPATDAGMAHACCDLCGACSAPALAHTDHLLFLSAIQLASHPLPPPGPAPSARVAYSTAVPRGPPVLS